MFAYCNNNPVLYADNAGNAPWPTTKAMSDCRAFDPQQAAAYRLAYYETDLTEEYPEVDGNIYKTFDAAIASEKFTEYSDDEDEFKAIVNHYARFLHQRIQQQIEKDDYGSFYTMSINHIYSETRAHILIWELSLETYEPTRIINLNVTESRPHVLLLMQYYGYDGKGGEFTYG